MSDAQYFARVREQLERDLIAGFGEIADGHLRVYASEVPRLSVLLYQALIDSGTEPKRVLVADLTTNPNLLTQRREYLAVNRRLIEVGARFSGCSSAGRTISPSRTSRGRCSASSITIGPSECSAPSPCETGRRVAGSPDVFPIGANLSFALPLSDDEVFVHTYERGAGLTPSCGSGVAAPRAVLSRLGLVEPERPVTVRNPGGVARSLLQPVGDVWQPLLEGNATVVYQAEIDPAVLLGDGPVEHSGEAHMAEISAFAELSRENMKVLHEAGIKPTEI